MQLIIPKGFNLIILTMTGASGVIVGLYGPVWIASLYSPIHYMAG